MIEGIERRHVWVVFGTMTHGNFYVGGHDDEERMVVIHYINEQVYLIPDEADDWMTSHGYDSYVIPTEFNGTIVYSKEFLKGLP